MLLNSLFYIVCAISTPHAVEECHLQKQERYLCSDHGGVQTRDLTHPYEELKCVDGKGFFSANYCLIHADDNCEDEI